MKILVMKRIMFVAALLTFTILTKADDIITVPAILKNVTVYRSGAEMIHSASASLKQGNNELIIENISNQIDINSVQIKSPSSVTIMGIRFSNDYLQEAAKTPRIKMLEDSLNIAKKNIEKINQSINNTKELLDVLKANRDIKGTQTGLSVAELTKLMDYYKMKLTELQNELSQLNEKKKTSEDALNKISNQLEEERNKNVSIAGRLTLQLTAATTGKFEFTISYIAQNAYWAPFYDVRVESTQKPLQVVYKAKITQTTGIDWKQVKLSLSTSVPNQWGNAPTLNQWFLGYVNPVAVMDKKLAKRNLEASLAGRVAGVQVEEVIVTGYGTQKITGDVNKETKAKPLYVVDGIVMDENEFQKINPSSIKKMEVLKGAAATAIYGSRGNNGAIVVTLKSGMEDYVTVSNNEMNVTFDISIPYDVPTNGKEQTATIQNFEIPANYKHYSVPKLDKDAYLLAEVSGWEKLNLLPGSANVIFEGTYVGKSFIDPNSTQDTLNLTLGKDKRISVKRDKLVDFSSVKFLGASKLQKFTYEITIKNNKNETAAVLLKDQFPLSTNKDIEVELLEAGGADVNKDLGILNWQLSLKPGETKKIRFAYSVKYPKDKVVNL